MLENHVLLGSVRKLGEESRKTTFVQGTTAVLQYEYSFQQKCLNFRSTQSCVSRYSHRQFPPLPSVGNRLGSMLLQPGPSSSQYVYMHCMLNERQYDTLDIVIKCWF